MYAIKNESCSLEHDSNRVYEGILSLSIPLSGESLKFHSFTYKNSDLYFEFRRLQYLCFVKELGLKIPSNTEKEITLASEKDHNAYFTIIEDEGNFIGGGAYTQYQNNHRPQSDYFEKVFENSHLDLPLNKLAVISGLCLLPGYNREKILLVRKLLIHILEELEKKNIQVAMLATGIKQIAISCNKLGFKMVTKPQEYLKGPIRKLASFAVEVNEVLQSDRDKISSQESQGKISRQLSSIQKSLVDERFIEGYLDELEVLSKIIY